MNAVALRRLLVFGVCAVGVCALYVGPNAVRTAGPAPAGRPVPDRSSSREPSPTPGRTTDVRVEVEPAASPTTRPPAEPVRSEPPRKDASLPDAAPRGRAPGGSTPYDPRHHADRVAPQPVETLVPASVSQDLLTLSWPPARDNVGVTAYRVWLDGFEVATTAETRATVRWFNDENRQHVVQVRALDAAGNVSDSSPNLLVARPTPEPTPLPTSPAPATPTPEPTPEPSGTPVSPSPTAPVPSAPVTPEGVRPGPTKPLSPASVPTPEPPSAPASPTPQPSRSGEAR